MKSISTILAAGSVALALAGGAFAQAPAGPGAEGARPMRHAHDGKFNPSVQADQRLAALKEKLKITGGQESQWNVFAARVKSGAEGMRAHHAAPAEQQNLTAPDRMAQRTEFMKQWIVAMEGTTAALRDLYAVLSSDQRAIADQHFAERGRRGHHGHRHAS